MKIKESEIFAKQIKHGTKIIIPGSLHTWNVWNGYDKNRKLKSKTKKKMCLQKTSFLLNSKIIIKVV